jgi:hypothetical protein
MRGEQAALRRLERQRGAPESETIFADLCHQFNTMRLMQPGK